MKWLRSVAVILAAGTVLAVGGCGDGRTTAVTRAQPVPAVSPEVTGPPELTVAVLQPMVDGATIPTAGLTTVGGDAKASTDDTRVDAAYLPCERPAAGRPVAGHYRFWSTKLVVAQSVSGYGEAVAEDLVAEARTAAASCRAFTHDGEPHEILGEVKLPAYAGVPAAYAWCERYRYQKARYVRCHAVLARGYVLSHVTVYGGDALGSGGKELGPVAAIAAKALGTVQGP